MQIEPRPVTWGRLHSGGRVWRWARLWGVVDGWNGFRKWFGSTPEADSPSRLDGARLGRWDRRTGWVGASVSQGARLDHRAGFQSAWPDPPLLDGRLGEGDLVDS